MNEAQQQEVLRKVQESYRESLRPSESIVSMLEKLQSSEKTLYLFTGGSPVHTIDKLRASGLWRYFRCVFTGDWHPFEDSAASRIIDFDEIDQLLENLAPVVSLGPNPKSSAVGYKLLLARASIESGSSLMIGNHLNDDVSNAQAAGLYAAQATWWRCDAQSDVIPNVVLNDPAALSHCFNHVVRDVPE